MTLPKTSTPPTSMNPKVLLMYGAAKVGKTKALEQLEDCLIIDTEKGTRAISGLKVEINSLVELTELIKELKKPENKNTYKCLALDTIDNLVSWIEKRVCLSHINKDGTPAKSIADIPFGGGWSQVRDMTLTVVKTLADTVDRLIIIGHRDRKIIGETSVEVSTNSLDLSGKLRNQLMAYADSIGYVYRKDGELRISFRGSDETEVGSRISHLRNQDIPLDWNLIYLEHVLA